MVEDLIRSRYILLLSFGFSMIILLVYMSLLRYLGRWIIWSSILMCVIVSVFAAGFCFMARMRIQKYSNGNKLADFKEMNVTFDQNEFDQEIISTDLTTQRTFTLEKLDTATILLDEFASMNFVWLTLGIICCILCSIFIVCTLCLWDRILLAAG